MAVKMFNSNYGIPQVNGKPRVSSTPYTYDIAEGNVSGHTNWSKIGYNPAIVASTEADVWSGTGTINFPAAGSYPAGMEVISSSANDDGSPAIFSGTSTSGSTTSLTDTGKDFTAGTAVAVGDCVILDKTGAAGTPEWGYVTAIVGTTTLTIGGGFSSGGTGSLRAYIVVDKSLSTGAQAVKIEYLTSAYATKSEICLLDGTTAVATTNTDYWRINSFRVIATGTGNTSAGNISLREIDDAPVFSYITAGYTRARNIAYTVPAGKTLYVHTVSFGYAYTHNSTHYARMYTRANVEPSTMFNTGNLFYPYSEAVVSNSTAYLVLTSPTKLPAKTDLKVSILADYAGIAECALRGWLE